MEKLTYTHNEAAAKVLASFYDTPPLAYVRSYGCQQNVNDGEKIKGVLQDVGVRCAAGHPSGLRGHCGGLYLCAGTGGTPALRRSVQKTP